jgi:hypothetical protein
VSEHTSYKYRTHAFEAMRKSTWIPPVFTTGIGAVDARTRTTAANADTGGRKERLIAKKKRKGVEGFEP